MASTLPPSRPSRRAAPSRRRWLRRCAVAVVVLAGFLGLGSPPAGAETPADPPTAPVGSPVAEHGRLQVDGSLLVDEQGRPVQLRGMSSHGLQYFPEFVNVDAVRWLHEDWGISVFRAAMYTENGGYVDDPELATARMREAIDAAAAVGVYVIVDWHVLYEGDPNVHRDAAIDFFTTMAADYGQLPNVIWEVANEPNGEDVTWGEDVKPYADAVIGAIRAHDPDNPVIVGSSTWSQDIHLAAADPVADDQVLYALHFYAGTHGQYLRDRIEEVMASGHAVFVSEWGVSEASGTGGVFESETREWVEFLNDRMIGWTNWNLSDKDETSAVLLPGADPRGGWEETDLSPAGLLVRELVAEQGAPGSYRLPQLARLTSAWVTDEPLRQRLLRHVEWADTRPRTAGSQLALFARAVDRGAAQGDIGDHQAAVLRQLSAAAGQGGR